MSAFDRLSIRNKLIAIFLIATVVPLVVGFSLVIFNDVRAFRREAVENALAIARVTGENTVAALTFGDAEDSTATLGKLGEIPDIEAAYIFDANGKLFSKFVRNQVAAVPHSPATGSRRFEGEHLYVTERIAYEGETYGSIELVISTAALDRRMAQHGLTLALLLLVLASASVVLALRLEKIVSRPILDLASTARVISESHDYSLRVRKTTDDEIGVLSDSFNDMLSQIERRQQERDEADRRTQQKSHFLANMSHELRTPLNAIIGFSEILHGRLADRVTAKERKFIENINYSGQHLLGLVNDILDLSKIEAGHIEVSPEPLSIAQLIEAVTNLMRGVSSRKNVSLHVDISEMPIVWVDGVKLKQILYNLLSNAVKFSSPNGMVRVSASAIAAASSPLGVDSVKIAVADKGIGIDPANHDLIFQEFQQIDSALSRQIEGTGLGLALVRKLVQMHGGVIRVDSALGSGATFTIILPLDCRASSGTQLAAVEAILPSPGERILVIEDEDEAFATIENELRGAGFLVVRARTGEEGLALAHATQPAAITLDIILPGVAGWKVLEMLKGDAKTRDIPVVIVSVVDNRELGFAFGADAYVTKPIDSTRLLDALQPLIDRRELREPSILVINDDREVHDLVDSTVGSKGYAIEHAWGAQEGLARAASGQPSIIVLDLTMEAMSGLETAVRIKTDPRTAHIPILALAETELAGGDRLRSQKHLDAIIQEKKSSGPELASMIQDLIRKSGARAVGE